MHLTEFTEKNLHYRIVGEYMINFIATLLFEWIIHTGIDSIRIPLILVIDYNRL